MPGGSTYGVEDVTAALAELARIMSIPTRHPSWVKPPWWALPLNETRTRIVPANTDWTDYITIQLGQTPGFAPEGYVLRLAAYVATGYNDPVVTGMEYRFLRDGTFLPEQEFGITDDIERHVERYAVAEPWPAFGRKMFLYVPTQGRLVLQVRNPDAAPQRAIAALYGYYYPNLGDLGRGGQETALDGHEDAVRDG